jgi:hypothetical protein
MEHVTIFGIMTVQTPPVLFRMLQYNIFMHLQFPALRIGFLIRMAPGTRENIFTKRGRRHLNVFLPVTGSRFCFFSRIRFPFPRENQIGTERNTYH